METRAEELGNDRVRLTVEVPVHDLKHAVEHAAGDLSESVKIPGFRKGKIPLPVLVSKLGKERIFGEAISTHIGGWFRFAATKSRLRPVTRPEFDFELPAERIAQRPLEKRDDSKLLLCRASGRLGDWRGSHELAHVRFRDIVTELGAGDFLGERFAFG